MIAPILIDDIINFKVGDAVETIIDNIHGTVTRVYSNNVVVNFDKIGVNTTYCFSGYIAVYNLLFDIEWESTDPDLLRRLFMFYKHQAKNECKIKKR